MMLGTNVDDIRSLREAKDEGKKEGKKEGKDETTRSIALNLLREGLPIEIITKSTGLTIAQVQALQEQANRS
jgi:predicted transposase/invertase (TIGR01784 family)